MARSSSARAVFLDRDGVLNAPVIRDGRSYPPATVEEMRLLDGVVEACTALKQAGFLLLCVTNQPDIARGTTTSATVERINSTLMRELQLDEVLTCPHDDGDACHCRKPKPGLLIDAAKHYGVDLSRSFMVGDRWRDIEAGRAAGCRTVYIDWNYRERQPDAADLTVSALIGAVQWIIDASHAANDLEIGDEHVDVQPQGKDFRRRC